MQIPAPLRELATVLAEGLVAPYRSFFRWNLAKCLCVLWGAGAALAFSLPGLAALGWGAWAVQERIPRDAVEALKGSGDLAAPAARVFEAVGVLPVLALFLGAAWVLAAVSFAWFHAAGFLYGGFLLRLAAGGAGARPLARAFSGKALATSLAVAAWTALAWIPASLVFLLVAFAAKAAFGAFGAASVTSPVTPWGLATLLADRSAPILPYELFLWAWSFFVALWMSLKFGFAPLALASDASSSGTGRSYVAASWRAFRGRGWWSAAFVLVGCSLAAFLLGKVLALALYFFPVASVPAAAAAMAAWGALRDTGTPARRAARALGAWTAFCAAYFATVTLASLPSLALGSYLGAAPVGWAAAFAFLGLETSFMAALWRRRAALPRP